MKLFVSIISVAALSTAMLLSGCSFTTAHFEEATMATSVDKDTKPVGRTTTFFRHIPKLHCSTLVANAPKDTKVKAVWLYKPAGAEVQRIDSAEMTIESGRWIDFSFTPSGAGLPYGNFAVDLFIDGVFKQTVPFTVKRMFEQGFIRETTVAASVNEKYSPTELATSFKTSTAVIYAPVYVEDAPAGSVVTAHWYGKNELGNDETIVSTDYPCEGSGWIGFSIKPNNALPAGKYFVDIIANGQVHNTMQFELQ